MNSLTSSPRVSKAMNTTVALVLGVIIIGGTATTASAADAFTALKGGWAGGGSASFAGGETEKLRCSARYSGGGNNLAISLKCASKSAQISLTGNLDANGNKVSGNWSENSFGLNGDAYGSTTGGSVRLKISGSLTGYLTLNVASNRHTFALSSKGTTLSGVNVSMGRR